MEEIYKLYDLEPETQPIGEGIEATVYPLDDERVIRIYKRGDASQQAKLESMREFYSSLDTSSVSFDVPEILSVDVNNGVVSTVDKRLHGQDFSTVYEALDPSERQKTLLSYLAVAQQIRRLAPPYQYFGEVVADDPIRESSWRDFLSRKMELAYDQGKKALDKDVPEIQQVLTFMKEQLPLFDDVREANLVHGDFYVSNVLVKDGEVSAVLDFNDLTLAGDYRMDVASAIIFLGDNGTGARDDDRKILIDQLVAEHGDGVKDIIHFYELYYAFIFSSYAKDTDPDTYKWAVNTLNQQAELDRLSVEIERAVPDDAETICDIRDRAWIEAYPNAELGITTEDVELNAKGRNGEFVPRRIADLKERLAKNDEANPGTFVAKIDGEVVGFIDPRIDEQGRRRPGAVYVAPEAQGKGVGSKLMQQVLDLYGRDQDIFLDVVSYNQNAIDFYERFGFVKTDTVVPDEEGRPDYMKSIPQIEMVLRANPA